MDWTWRAVVAGALAVALVVPAGPAAAKTNVMNLNGGGARPSCTFEGLAGDLYVDGGGTDWYGGLNLPDPDQGNEWQPIAEGPLTGDRDTLRGTWELYKEPYGTVQIDLTIGKVVARETPSDEEGKLHIAYYEMSGTVMLDGEAYPITGCQYKEFRS